MQANSAFVKAGLVLVLALAAGSSFGQAKDNALTLYAAYRDGGSFTDVNSGSELRIEASGAASLSLDWRLDASRQLQLFLSRQSSQMGTGQATPVPPGSVVPTKFPLRVTYLHLGGTSFLEGSIGQGVYLVGGLGATLFEPGVDGFENELRPSINLGIGYQLPLGESVALRFEARGYATLVNSDSGVFCSGGCVISIKGDTVTQGDVQIGLSFRY
jgi:hypothetical protein